MSDTKYLTPETCKESDSKQLIFALAATNIRLEAAYKMMLDIQGMINHLETQGESIKAELFERQKQITNHKKN